jgi:hypothetical protein
MPSDADSGKASQQLVSCDFVAEHAAILFDITLPLLDMRMKSQIFDGENRIILFDVPNR